MKHRLLTIFGVREFPAAGGFLSYGPSIVDAMRRTIVYADAARDGTLAGPDLAGARALAQPGLEVIVSGGIASLDDLRAARGVGLAGAVVGRALHESLFTVEEALACVA